jgi:hypothetical protein
MKVNNEYIKIIYIISLIVLGEITRQYKYLDMDPLLFMWMMLSLGTVYYIGLVLYNRKEIRDTNKKYIEPGKKYDIINIKEYIIDTFGVFGNNIDNRYLDPNSIVYLGEGINIIFSIILAYLILFSSSPNKMKYIKYVLYGQVALTVGYYLTFRNYRFDNIYNILGTFAVLPWGLIPLIILSRSNTFSKENV